MDVPFDLDYDLDVNITMTLTSTCIICVVHTPLMYIKHDLCNTDVTKLAMHVFTLGFDNDFKVDFDFKFDSNNDFQLNFDFDFNLEATWHNVDFDMTAFNFNF